ncbi:hypothetical protein N0V83_008509 [Neocucurbitaria cava]|uniref:SprT-like domain-containing protein n=1 Tax=Neocucurbitaria cava TaxID=798079 RepID=A0A9W9CJR2_9PLEO|nr:hypothetical protein N0V83_008509 [Neocucurbitaria cava]
MPPILVPKSSRRNLRLINTSYQDSENSFLSKTFPAVDALTPRKQRILRPVESNSRLLRKLSDESLASPEKNQRERRVRSGTTDTDVGKRGRLMYAKSLAKSVVNKQARKGRIDVVGEAEAQEAARRPRSKGSEKPEEVQEIEVDEEVETSLWCGDDDDAVQEPEEAQVEIINDKEDDEDDDDPVVDVRNRRRQPRSRHIVSDSDDDESEASEQEVRNNNRQPSFKLPERKAKEVPEEEEAQPLMSMRPPHRKGHSTISNWAQEVIDLTSSPRAPALDDFPPPTLVRTTSFAASSRPTSSASNGALAILTYSPTPTKHRSPRKAPPISRPSTPPLPSASPSKLVSPSKKRPVVPKAEHLDGRPSLDAFWNPVEVNEWNEKHSPSKPLVSPRKQKWREDIVKMMEGVALEDSSDEDKGYESPSTSPRKKKNPASAPRSPTKKKPSLEDDRDADLSVKEIRAQRKAFADRKHALATAFLTDLDNTICAGQISALSAPTGGIKLVWSNTLKTTAGRANWRRETIRTRSNPPPPTSSTSSTSTIPSSTPLTTEGTQTTVHHHCTIELASKVIDSTPRLYNVLAHEFCHLTTFMLSNIRNNPHGAEFKAWGRKVSSQFAHLGVEVTTKHSYSIEYKYVWECVECAAEFKRHSRSVDPGRHSCGKCRGRLAQVKPVPRGGGGAGGKGMGVQRREEREQRGRRAPPPGALASINFSSSRISAG